MASRSSSRKRVLRAHVPVDEVVIVNGPAPTEWAEAYRKLLAGSRSVPILFTLKTAASTTTFRGNLRVSSINEETHNETGVYRFKAVYSNEVVSGLFSILTRLGMFSLY